MASSSLCFILLFIQLFTADGFMHYYVAHCNFNSTEMKDIEYIISYYFNKEEYLSFSSSLGKFVGYNEYGMKQADYWNNDPSEMSWVKASKATFCKPNIDLYYQYFQSVKPSVTLYSTPPPAGNHPAVLVCSVYDFFPKTIKVSWQRDGQEVTSDVTSTEETEDGDWSYQIHSYLESTPRSGEKISCVVEHASLSQPLITDWDPSMPESERNKITIGASGLILGLILSLAGFIYYKRKSQGRILVPTT